MEIKGQTDPVTEVDKKSEESIISSIRGKYSRIIPSSRKSPVRTPAWMDARWHIDPLDGTINFAHGLPFFCVSIAYEKDGNIQLGVVYDPMRDELYSAERGKGAWLNGETHPCFPYRVTDSQSECDRPVIITIIRRKWTRVWNSLIISAFMGRPARRLGSAALNMCYVACGRMDFYFELVVQSYDVAAGILLVEEAGGMVTKTDGSARLPQFPRFP